MVNISMIKAEPFSTYLSFNYSNNVMPLVMLNPAEYIKNVRLNTP